MKDFKGKEHIDPGNWKELKDEEETVDNLKDDWDESIKV